METPIFSILLNSLLTEDERIEYIIRQAPEYGNATALQLLIQNYDRPAAVSFLLECLPEEERQNYLLHTDEASNTALIVAADLGHTATVAAMLRSLPSLDMKENLLYATTVGGETALHFACGNNHVDTAAVLLDSLPRALQDLYIFRSSENRFTALQTACDMNAAAAASLLLDRLEPADRIRAILSTSIQGCALAVAAHSYVMTELLLRYLNENAAWGNPVLVFDSLCEALSAAFEGTDPDVVLMLLKALPADTYLRPFQSQVSAFGRLMIAKWHDPCLLPRCHIDNLLGVISILNFFAERNEGLYYSNLVGTTTFPNKSPALILLHHWCQVLKALFSSYMPIVGTVPDEEDVNIDNPRFVPFRNAMFGFLRAWDACCQNATSQSGTEYPLDLFWSSQLPSIMEILPRPFMEHLSQYMYTVR
eukprot:TRINITY_DN15199_c0_g1::TRINITY_DN15199_c0_g1_i1::g.30636::m.30636 TRINITY_DN15199_c0_g1::TRINITY_DN15199_c0_g1_i1::g.30636  ORF type:complete len:422 (+),score=15.90,Ank_3/PF13606.1/23,Ank_3/PF13606.1/5.4,Ank_3/PF13606.1/0.0049,Ank_3/PF13606.1/1.5,Ank_3/PF13606.1/3.7e+03,Ank_3/PF13606.1/1.5e+04,Ank_2/PF12796.2/4.7e-08,Ank_2/PF12796.2/8.1e-05,Ank_2/PF12796.2/15,Ank_5/PF13857.1/37,Ank_5/PF13857.1/11,Ank_5/PF13857.1/0.068,Ank_5/PF13857.1/23,Ank_5/PF13857.1/4.6e+02,Ank_5/PF13857.1/3.9,Ank/PF00023.25